jgi:hypothetical protein
MANRQEILDNIRSNKGIIKVKWARRYLVTNFGTGRIDPLPTMIYRVAKLKQ